jgi:hypothetical protein
MIYFIRKLSACLPEHFTGTRTMETVRKSLDGKLCIMVFEEDDVPDEWEDGSNVDEMISFINSEDNKGVWWSDDM